VSHFWDGCTLQKLLVTNVAKVFPAAGLPWIEEVAFGIGTLWINVMGIRHLVVLHRFAHDGTLDPKRMSFNIGW
jgi:hypothetical protein